jgi:hypothetical protein
VHIDSQFQLVQLVHVSKYVFCVFLLAQVSALDFGSNPSVVSKVKFLGNSIRSVFFWLAASAVEVDSPTATLAALHGRKEVPW